MLQQPLARRVAGAARYAAAGEALPGALPLSSMRRRARGLRAAAVPSDGTTDAWTIGGASGAGRKRPGLPGEALEVEESGSVGTGPRPQNPTKTQHLCVKIDATRVRQQP